MDNTADAAMKQNHASFFAQPISRRNLIRGAGAAAAAVASASLLAACTPGGATTSSSGSTGSTSKKTLNLMLASWVDASFVSEVMQKSAADPLGIKLNIITVDDGTFPAQAAAAQKSGQAPDLIFWTAQGIPPLQAAGVKLADLGQYADAEDKSAFYTQDYQASTIGGKLYGLGFRCDCRGIVYRTDYAKAAGLTVPKKWSFDEFGAWAAKLNGANQIGFGFESKVGDGRASSNFLPLLWSTGAKLVTGESGNFKIGFTEAEISKVLGFYSDAVHKWKSTPTDAANWGYQDTDGDFSKGLLASYSAGPFVLANVAKFPQTRDNLGVAPLPNAGKPSSFWEEHTLMIQGDSKNQDLAAKFIHNMRSAETQKLIASRTGDAQLAVRRASNSAITNPVLKSFADLLDVSVVPEPVNATPIMNNAVLPAIEAVVLNANDVPKAASTLMSAMQTTLAQLNEAA
jgi:multiple sugar transport system substrate-binding protein